MAPVCMFRVYGSRAFTWSFGFLGSGASSSRNPRPKVWVPALPLPIGFRLVFGGLTKRLRMNLGFNRRDGSDTQKVY